MSVKEKIETAKNTTWITDSIPKWKVRLWVFLAKLKRKIFRRLTDMSKTLMYNTQGKDVTCMKEYDAIENPCKVCDITDCEEKMISEVIVSDNEYKCCICGKPTKYIEINYQAPFCSDECIAKMDKQSNNDIQRIKEKLSSMNEEEFDDMLKQCGIEETKPSIASDYNKALTT